MIMSIPTFPHLSKSWKLMDILSLAKASIVNIELDTYPLPMSVIRLLYNQAIGDIEDIIMMTDSKSYEIIYPIELEDADFNLKKVDLSDAVFTAPEAYGSLSFATHEFIPINYTKSIVGAFTAQKGAFVERTFDDLISISTNENSLYKHSLFFARNGHEVYFYLGEEFIEDDDTFFLKVIRKPILDDLKMPNTDFGIVDFSKTFHYWIDIPDRYIKLLNLQLKKECLEYLSQPIPEELESKIANIIQLLTSDKQMKQVDNTNMKDKIS